MSVRLGEILDCFEGVIPSIIATLDSQGVPNVSYLSQVWFVDDEHVALSNQFFSKTTANVMASGKATAMVVDGRNGSQYLLDLAWERSLFEGDVFEHMAAHLRAISSVHGTDAVMRLRSAEIYRVLACDPVPPVSPAQASPAAGGARLALAARLAASVASEAEADPMIDRVLDGLVDGFGFANLMVLAPASEGAGLVTLASRGYASGGVGSEVAPGQGAIGIAAETGRPVRLCDMSRGRRMASAVASQTEPDEARVIPLPGLAEPQSQLAVPMVAQGKVSGVLFAEASQRFAFTREDQDALALIGAQLAASLRLAELQSRAPPGVKSEPRRAASGARAFHVRRYAFDDSVFIDDVYIIKGVPGRLLAYFLQAYVSDGRRAFTNREVRLDPQLRLPDLKDNLETRLILLRRRLEERGAPVRLRRPGRGLIELELDGAPVLETTPP